MTRSALPLFLAAILLAANASLAQEKSSGFQHKVYKDKEGEEKYVVFVPKSYTGDKPYPVILFLHGSGESGSDGNNQTKVGLGKAIRDKGEKFPFIAIFPQSHMRTWKASSLDGQRAVAILDETLKQYKTDPKRVYLTGLSMGGAGTWSFAAAHPERWAAIAPICGGQDTAIVPKIKDIPCWAFVGDADTKPFQSMTALVKGLKDAGAMPKFTVYPKVGHNSWDRAYATAELYEWFLKQSTK